MVTKYVVTDKRGHKFVVTKYVITKTYWRQLFSIVYVLAKSIQWNTIAYQNPIKSHKSIVSRFKGGEGAFAGPSI